MDQFVKIALIVGILGGLIWLAYDNIDYIDVEMEVTAYCPCEECCGKFADGFTASGEIAECCFVAAPPEYPFGTMMLIPGYNHDTPVKVLDRGGVIKGNKLDVFFSNHLDALIWGRQTLIVRVFKD